MVHADEDALDPREEEHHDLPLALVTHHLEGDGDVAKIGHSVSHTVCPKVACNSNVPLFSAKCGWIPKPFGLLIAHMVRFVMIYDMALLLTN